MWIMTTSGFYSAVQHRDNPDTLLVRARSHADLVALVGLAQAEGDTELTLDSIVEKINTGADYPFRLSIGKAEFERILARVVSDIDYDNFKNAVADNEGGDHARAHTYGRVWSALHAIEKEPTAGVYAPPKTGMGKGPKVSKVKA